MPPRQVVTPENLSRDFTVDLLRADGPVGVNLAPARFTRDPTTGLIDVLPFAPPAMNDLSDVITTGITNGQFLAFNGATATYVPTSLPAALGAADVKALYESNADTNAFTNADKTKLDTLIGSRFVGTFASFATLAATHTTNAPGSYAFVDSGVAGAATLYIWDESDSLWRAGVAASMPASEVKTLYESNANTNAFTDAEKAKLAGISFTAVSTKTANYDLTAADFAGAQVIAMNMVAANTVTVPPALVVTEGVSVVRLGAGITTIVAGVGVTLRSADGHLALRVQYSSAHIIPLAVDDYLVLGDLDA